MRGVLRRLIGRLRQSFPKAAIRVRLGGFASPDLFAELEDQGVEYLVAMAKNAVLNRAADPLLDIVRTRAIQQGHTAKLYGETRYQARSWHRTRRVIFKAEVVSHPGRDPQDNPRFVVTNLRHAPQRLYDEIYCARGDSENRLKELHHELAFGRTSCSSFWANQVHVTLSN